MEVVENKKDGGVEAARRWGGKMMNNVGLWVVSFQLVGRGGKMKTLVGIPALVENPPHPSKKMNIGVNAYSQKLRRNLGGGAGLGRRGCFNQGGSNNNYYCQPILISFNKETIDWMKGVYQRWKEQYFVNVGVDCGLTIAGFYYVCFACIDGIINGFYYDPNSSPFQKLELKSTNEGRSGYTFSSYELQ